MPEGKIRQVDTTRSGGCFFRKMYTFTSCRAYFDHDTAQCGIATGQLYGNKEFCMRARHKVFLSVTFETLGWTRTPTLVPAGDCKANACLPDRWGIVCFGGGNGCRLCFESERPAARGCCSPR